MIGEELRAQALAARSDPVIVIGAPELTRRYETALRCFGIPSRLVGAEATWHGLWALAQHLEIR